MFVSFVGKFNGKLPMGGAKTFSFLNFLNQRQYSYIVDK